MEANHIRHNFRFGSQLHPSILNPDNMADQALMVKQYEKVFNYVVFDPFYWGSWEPERGITDQSIYGRPLEWAEENKFPIKGHTLSWPHRPLLPEWIYDMPADTVELLLMKRIEDITREFRGIIQEWKTKIDLITDFNGWIAFRGFNGLYEFCVWQGRKKLGDYQVHVSAGVRNTWSFIIE